MIWSWFDLFTKDPVSIIEFDLNISFLWTLLRVASHFCRTTRMEMKSLNSFWLADQIKHVATSSASVYFSLPRVSYITTYLNALLHCWVFPTSNHPRGVSHRRRWYYWRATFWNWAKLKRKPLSLSRPFWGETLGCRRMMMFEKFVAVVVGAVVFSLLFVVCWV